MIHRAFPRAAVISVEPLTEGFRNSNFKLRLDVKPGTIVLRIYEHDHSLCQKEIDLLRLVSGSVPVPEVLYAQAHTTEEIPPFALLEYVEGINFRELKRSDRSEAIAQAAHSAGHTLAAIGRMTFPKSGWVAAGPTVTSPLLEGANALPRFVDLCLESNNLQRRLNTDLRDRIHVLVWRWAPELASLEHQTSLVHCDFGSRNLLVRNVRGKWEIAAVLDWEFAVSGAPLIDIGHFLRYECEARPVREPHFSTGYLEADGTLPRNWRQLARIIDLSALCESLTREQLPAHVETELIELVKATVEGRDPQLA
jgi:aminoglycoside phosphotransferase (APT) family kinase protein